MSKIVIPLGIDLGYIEEGQEFLRWGPNSYRPRRIELTEMKLVEDAGYTRRTHAKRQAVVWRAVPLD